MTFKFTPIVTWNTGRHYTEHGQRITVHLVHIGGVPTFWHMVDVDRGLAYWFDIDEHDRLLADSPNVVKHRVLALYDYNLGHNSPLSIDDPELRDALWWAGHETALSIEQETHRNDRLKGA
jgi:hypothetical protein